MFFRGVREKYWKNRGMNTYYTAYGDTAAAAVRSCRLLLATLCVKMTGKKTRSVGSSVMGGSRLWGETDAGNMTSYFIPVLLYVHRQVHAKTARKGNNAACCSPPLYCPSNRPLSPCYLPAGSSPSSAAGNQQTGTHSTPK